MKAVPIRWGQLVLAAGLLAAGAGQARAACGAETTISPNEDYALSFKVCEDRFVGTVTARSAGWVAVGFSQDQYMPQTDVFMAGVLADGTAYARDAFAVFRSPPVTDAQQDVNLLSITEADGVTRYTFSRLLKTGDTDGDYDLTQGTHHILMAFNATSDAMTDRHTFADASELAYAFAPVPEPQTLVMLLAGLGWLAMRATRQPA